MITAPRELSFSSRMPAVQPGLMGAYEALSPEQPRSASGLAPHRQQSASCVAQSNPNDSNNNMIISSSIMPCICTWGAVLEEQDAGSAARPDGRVPPALRELDQLLLGWHHTSWVV